MKTNQPNRSSGIAIIVVMIAITVLSILTAAFAFTMKVETKLAQNADSEVELLWLGRSGVEYARWILAQQMTIANEPYDALNQVWAGGPGGEGTTNSPLAGISLKDYALGAGKFSLTIVDLERKANVNVADELMLQQAFTLMGVDPGESAIAVNSILDWVDPDDDTHINGAESDYYQGLQPPYFSKNAPIDDLSELLLIKGISPEMYWGSQISAHPPAKFQGSFGRANLSAQDTTYACTLQDLFTPISSGRININTASLLNLQMIPGIDENTANLIIKLRAGPDGEDGTDDDTPFHNVGELINAGISGQVVQSISKYCTVRSATYQVTVDTDINGYKRQFIAILGRTGPKDVSILSFYWK